MVSFVVLRELANGTGWRWIFPFAGFLSIPIASFLVELLSILRTELEIDLVFKAWSNVQGSWYMLSAAFGHANLPD